MCDELLPVVPGGVGVPSQPVAAAASVVRSALRPPIPKEAADAHLYRDLAWFRRPGCRRASKVAEHAFGMFFFGGLRWKEIAKPLE